MATIFITTGLVCIITAIVGGGLEAFNIKIPTIISSIKRQILLAIFGIGSLIFGIIRESPKPNEKAGTDTATKDSPVELDTSIQIPGTVYFPVQVGKGDRDLNSGPDNPFLYILKGEIAVDPSVIRSHVYMRIEETKGDKTAAEGWSSWETVFRTDSGWEIASVNPVMRAERRGYHSDKGGFGMNNLNEDEVVKKFWIKGDRIGDDIPGYSQIVVEWRPLNIKLVKRRP
jgi:hypothetical protein